MNPIKTFFTKEIIIGVFRHLLTLLSGALLVKGIDVHTQITTLSAAASDPTVQAVILAIVGIAGSVFHKQDVAKQITAAQNALPATPPTSAPLVSPRAMPLILALLIGFSANAQTTNTATLLPNLPLGSIGKVIGTNGATAVQSAWNLIADIEPYFGTNSQVQVFAGPLYDSGLTKKNQFGGFVACNFTHLNNIDIGASVFYLNKQVFYGPMSVKLGTTMVLPVIGSIQAWGCVIPDVCFNGSALGVMTMAGADKAWDIGGNKLLFVGGSVGTDTHLPGNIFSGHVGVNF